MDVAVGIDVAKEFHWVVATRPDQETGKATNILSRRVDNTPGAIADLVDEMAGLVAPDESLQVGIDILGGIARLLETILLTAGLEVVHVPGLAVKTARRATRGGEHKSDPRDARVIADQVRSRDDLRRVALLNDADAAGLAEMKFGAGQGQPGVVMMLTFGTGIGSALFINGQLVPNTELGHVELRGKDAELRAAARIREEKGLSWKRWAKRVNEYLAMIEKLFSPDLIIFGGGVSKEHGKFFQYLESRAPVVPAVLFNEAGIVGAALAAQALVGEQTIPMSQ